MADTSIEWTDKVWNPVRGCDIYSPECINCYAMRQAHRHSREDGAYAKLTVRTRAGPVWVGRVEEVPAQLGAPLQWKRGSRVFVNSMSDLFYGDEADRRRAVARRVEFRPVSVDFITACFEIMAACPQHEFQILTKRVGRMREVLLEAMHRPPLPNVLIGCSVGTRDASVARQRHMREISEAGWRTWVSYEPAIERVDWSGWEFIRWLVAGAESGYGKREPLIEWFEGARAWCAAHRIPFFMKQLVSSGRRGRKLEFEHFPSALRVREWPR